MTKHGIVAALLSAVLSRTATDGLRDRSLGRNLTRALSRVVKGSWLLLHPRTCLEVVGVLASPMTQPLLRSEPRLLFKYLYGYLAKDLSRAERAAMLINHYRFLKERATNHFFSGIVDGRFELWDWSAGGSVHHIWLGFPHKTDGEGDLALIFEADGIDLYTLSFTIGPGRIAGLDVSHTMYIARVQGKGKGLDRIREATKNCVDVSPAMLLLSAAEGIAEALGLQTMVGIGAAGQMSTAASTNPQDLVRAYDEFWIAVGGSRLARNMYLLTVPASPKSILSVKRDHRSRTHRKRRFKKAVAEQVGRAFRAAALKSPARADRSLSIAAHQPALERDARASDESQAT